MEQRDPEVRVVVQQRSRLQPVEQFARRSGAVDDRRAGSIVASRQLRAAACEGEQVQVVIAEHGDGGIAERP